MFGNGPGHLLVFADQEDEQPYLEFKGSFEQNLFHGYGVLELESEGTYQGHFEKGKKNGNGKLDTFASVYEGMWKDDEKHGPGTLTNRIKNTVFTGQMSHGLMQSGTLKY